MSGFTMFDDAPTSDQLASVVSLAEQQLQLEDQVARLTSELERATAALRQVQERDLPESMSLAGLESYTLSGGRKVGVETKIVASPAADQKPEMLEWLNEHAFGDIIKHEIKVAFGRGEDALADRMIAWAKANLPKQKLDDKEFVHPQTLNAFVREQMARQIELPDAFGVLVLKKAVISRPLTKAVF
jgi:hypothetical protein